jgi:hypothetical protein
MQRTAALSSARIASCWRTALPSVACPDVLSITAARLYWDDEVLLSLCTVANTQTHIHTRAHTNAEATSAKKRPQAFNAYYCLQAAGIDHHNVTADDNVI